MHESIKLYAKWEAGASVTGTKIYNLNDLAKVANNPGGTYVLMNNINCEGLALPTIGANSSTPFTGLFDGQGYTISNYVASGGEYIGLFGYNSGTIRNLNVADFKLEQTNTVSFSILRVGGIAGYNNGVIESCGVTNGNINIIVNANRYGGLITGENNGIIRNCYSQGIVNINQLSQNTNYAYAAGIAGMNNKTIENTYANVQITSYSYNNGVSFDAYYGYAAMIAASNKGSVKNSLAFGSANGNGKAGDITAVNSKGTVENCYKDEAISLSGTPTTFATPMSRSSLSSANFYSISLKWDKAIWYYQNVNLVNNKYPTLIQ